MAKRQTTRAPNRPQEGDLQPCPFCRAMMVFHEQQQDVEPGWFCQCGYQKFVRQSAKPTSRTKPKQN